MQRLLLIQFGVLWFIAPLAGCAGESADAARKRLIILGFDGMDPRLTREMLDADQLPNFARLAKAGGFKALGTSTPPQSPVAWSSLITGTDPGKHGIFDFIHRNPETYIPYASTTRSTEVGWSIDWWDPWKLPLSGGEVENLCQGTPFWEYLTQAGIDAHVYRMPANYPPKPAKGPGEFLTLTDMGTPDLKGTQGEFSFYTTGTFEGSTRNITGGNVYRPISLQGVIKAKFYGMTDPLLNPDVAAKKARQPLETDFTIFRDPDQPTVLIEWRDHRVVMREGEWSDWQTVEFSFGPSVKGMHIDSVTGSFRMYLRKVRPALELYVTPIQIDPLDPMLPIAYPDDFSQEVAGKVGRYFTQGLCEDTKALTHKILSREEFLQQAKLVLDERMKLLDFALDRYSEGFLFFYFGSTDQVAHMFWGTMVEDHPAISDEDRRLFHDEVRKTYIRADEALGKVMQRYPDATILCVSDHGFLSFSRGFNLNSWLVENGYATLRSGASGRDIMSFDWSKTQAYGIGINGLYVNLKGREGQGIVDPHEKQALMDDLTDKLLAYRDPDTDQQVIKEVYQAQRVYSPDQISIGPDMQIGYASGYRGSWATALGGTPLTRDKQLKPIVEDNTDAWCGDHCVATDLVPGVIFSNQPILLDNPDLEDIAPTILDVFAIPVPEQMTGSSVFETRRQTSSAAKASMQE